MRDRNLILTQYAHHHREHLTDSEARLWLALRSHQLGVQFRRQVVLLGYIVDFFAPTARLVVEVDAGYHARTRKADGRRDHRLGRAGVGGHEDPRVFGEVHR